MRIISGQFKSRRLLPPPTDETRPITDRVKESVFNLLRGRVEDSTFLDFFSGSGSVGLEALSRGAAKVMFVERSRKCARVLEKNIETLGVEDRSEITMADAFSPACLVRVPAPVDLVFFDPPYAVWSDETQVEAWKAQMGRLAPLLHEDAFVMVRTVWPLHETEMVEGMTRKKARALAIERSEASLQVDGYFGPETHDYRGMAVHFYQAELEDGDNSGPE